MTGLFLAGESTKRPFREFHRQHLLWRYGIGAAMVERGAIVPPDGSPKGNGCDGTKGDVSSQGGDGPNPDVLVRYGTVDRALGMIGIPMYRDVIALAYGDAGAIVTGTWEHMGRQWRSVAHLTDTARAAAESDTWGGKMPAPKVRPVKGEMWDQRERDLGGPPAQRLVRLLGKLTPRQLGPEGRELAASIEKAATSLLWGAEDAFALAWTALTLEQRTTATAAGAAARASGKAMAFS